MNRLLVIGCMAMALAIPAMVFAQTTAPATAPSALKVGDKAPNFKLEGSDGKTPSTPRSLPATVHRSRP